MKTLLCLITALSFLVLAGCGTHRPKPDEADAAGAAKLEASDSGVDISYFLGHVHRRLVVQTKDDQIVAQSYLERQILKETDIDRDHYADFLKKAKSFMENPQRVPATQAPCRNPYTVTLRVGKDSKVINGCRSSDEEGALSHLVREGEFLLYSKK